MNRKKVFSLTILLCEFCAWNTEGNDDEQKSHNFVSRVFIREINECKGILYFCRLLKKFFSVLQILQTLLNFFCVLKKSMKKREKNIINNRPAFFVLKNYISGLLQRYFLSKGWWWWLLKTKKRENRERSSMESIKHAIYASLPFSSSSSFL